MRIPHFETRQQFDNYLHQLYADKNYYVFFYGLDYFNIMIEKVHKKWVGPYGNDWMIDRTIWEIENLGEIQ